jgi:hypothetical protein
LEDAVHPSFQSWDAALKVPWTGKPRFTDPAVNVKAAVFQKQAGSGRKGCDFMVPTTTYTPQIWGGGVTPRPDIADRDDLELEEVKAFKWFIVMEAPHRAAFRMQYDRPDLAFDKNGNLNIDEITYANDLHKVAWQNMVNDFNKESRLIEVVNFVHPDTFKQVVEDYNDVPTLQIVLGYVFMGTFIFLSLFRFQRPGYVVWIVGLAGLFTVFLCQLTSLSLFFLAGEHLNAITMGVLPFFVPGLGRERHVCDGSHLCAAVSGTPDHS